MCILQIGPTDFIGMIYFNVFRDFNSGTKKMSLPSTCRWRRERTL